MFNKAKFNFKPVMYDDMLTIHKGGVIIDVEVSRASIISIISQLNEEEKCELIEWLSS